MTPIETVQQIYAAFGRGDVPAILACLADDVEWEYGTGPNPVPWLQPLHGRGEVPRFFQALGEGIRMESFRPKQCLSDGALVVSLVDVELTVRATGRRVTETDEVHVWHFDDAGRVRRFRHGADTYGHVMALRGEACQGVAGAPAAAPAGARQAAGV